MTNPFIQFAPKTTQIQELRFIQVDVLNKLWELFPTTKRFKIIAPVGAGKSVIALSIAKYAESLELHTLISSPLNELVNQYDNNFAEVGLFTLKGRRNYPCMAGRKHCGVGYCRTDDCSKGMKIRECYKHEVCYNCKCKSCVYPPLIKQFKGSTIANTNFSMFLLGITNEPHIIILDEADLSEDFTRLQFTVTLNGMYNEDFNIAIREMEITLDALNLQLQEAIKLNQKEKVKEFEELTGKIYHLIDDYYTHQEPWAITVYRDRKGNHKTKFEPISTERFIEPLLENKIVFLMSATIQKNEGDTAIEVDSPFPIEVRPWQYLPKGRMSKKYREKSIPTLASWLSTLKGKTLVHCHSYALADSINLALLALGKHPLIQTNSDDEFMSEDVVKRWDAVKAFKTAKDPHKILLSVKLDRGVDFSEPEIVNNVIACLAFPNPTEPLTKAKNKLYGEIWQPPTIATDVEQKYGRIHRNEKLGTVEGREVAKKTYITDSNFGWFYKDNKEKFHKWFLEAKVKI